MTIANKYEPIGYKEMQRLLEEKLEPYKAYGNVNEILNTNKHLKPKSVNQGKGYVIFFPDKYDDLTRQVFSSIDEFGLKLGYLYNLQMRYSELWESNQWSYLPEVQKQIDVLHNEVYGIGSLIKSEQHEVLPTKEQQIVEEVLKPLNGYWNGDKIMKQEEYEQVKELTIKFVHDKKFSSKIIPIPQTKISTEFIRKTFHELYLKFGKKDGMLWVKFIHKLFWQFGKDKSNKGFSLKSTYRNFKLYRGKYEIDKNSITYNA